MVSDRNWEIVMTEWIDALSGTGVVLMWRMVAHDPGRTVMYFGELRGGPGFMGGKEIGWILVRGWDIGDMSATFVREHNMFIDLEPVRFPVDSHVVDAIREDRLGEVAQELINLCVVEILGFRVGSPTNLV